MPSSGTGELKVWGQVEGVGTTDTVTLWVFEFTPLLQKNMSLASECPHHMINCGYLGSGCASCRPVVFPISQHPVREVP